MGEIVRLDLKGRYFGQAFNRFIELLEIGLSTTSCCSHPLVLISVPLLTLTNNFISGFSIKYLCTRHITTLSCFQQPVLGEHCS